LLTEEITKLINFIKEHTDNYKFINNVREVVRMFPNLEEGICKRLYIDDGTLSHRINKVIKGCSDREEIAIKVTEYLNKLVRCVKD
jgi:translation initiation factor 2 beta subunit (eIF-2beta)/eIF-5